MLLKKEEVEGRNKIGDVIVSDMCWACIYVNDAEDRLK